MATLTRSCFCCGRTEDLSYIKTDHTPPIELSVCHECAKILDAVGRKEGYGRDPEWR